MSAEHNEINQGSRAKQKKMIIEELKKTPIIQFACQKCNIPRATFYRWMKDNKKFSEEVKKALESGCSLINDLAESQAIAKIKNGDRTMIIFWLKYRHPAFIESRRLNYTKPEIDVNRDPLTPEKKAQIYKAFKNWGLVKTEGNTNSSGQGDK
jgi:hypothetical protein